MHEHASVFLRFRHHALGFQIGVFMVSGLKRFIKYFVRFSECLLHVAMAEFVFKKSLLGAIRVKNGLQLFIPHPAFIPQPFHRLFVRAAQHGDRLADIFHSFPTKDRRIIQNDFDGVFFRNIPGVHIKVPIGKRGCVNVQYPGARHR